MIFNYTFTLKIQKNNFFEGYVYYIAKFWNLIYKINVIAKSYIYKWC